MKNDLLECGSIINTKIELIGDWDMYADDCDIASMTDDLTLPFVSRVEFLEHEVKTTVRIWQGWMNVLNCGYGMKVSGKEINLGIRNN